MNDSFWQAAYIIAALCVVLSIKWLNSPITARRGVRAGEFGMLLAVVGTLLLLDRWPAAAPTAASADAAIEAH